MREQCLAHLNSIHAESKAGGDTATQLRAYDIHWAIQTGRLNVGQQWTITHKNRAELLALIHTINAASVPGHAGGTLDWLENNIERNTTLLP